jgi:hypothetical protein
LLTKTTVFASERCLDDAFPHKPPTDVWKDIRKRGRKQKQGAKTFENNSILGAPKVAERLPVRDLISLNMYKAWFTSEYIELVGMPKILDRVNFDIVPICLRQCRELCIEMRELSETQTFLLIIETAKVPQNLLKAWIVTEHL